MYWKKTLGTSLYNDVKKYLSGKKISISTLVRLAVEKYIANQ